MPVKLQRQPCNLSVPFSTAGFTLVELMVAVAVVAIIAAIAYPSFTSLFNSNRLTGSSNDLVTDLQYARSEAIRRNVRITVCASADTVTCTGAGGDWQAWIVVDEAGTAPDNVLRIGHAKSTLALSASSAISDDDNRVVFRSDGFARQADGNLLVASLAACMETTSPPENMRVVQIAAGSRISTVKKDGGGECNAPQNSDN